MKQRRAAKIDSNQNQIVQALRDMPGVEVSPGHDDILVGYKGLTLWYEVKNPETAFLADGVTFKKGALKPAQVELRRNWTGHYKVVSTLDEILEDMKCATKQTAMA